MKLTAKQTGLDREIFKPSPMEWGKAYVCACIPHHYQPLKNDTDWGVFFAIGRLGSRLGKGKCWVKKSQEASLAEENSQ